MTTKRRIPAMTHFRLCGVWSDGGREGGREGGRWESTAQVLGEVYVNNNKNNNKWVTMTTATTMNITTKINKQQ